MLERLEPVEAGVEVDGSECLLPDLAAVHLRRLERLEGSVDAPGYGDADGRPSEAHLAALDGDARRPDPDHEARLQEECPVEARRALVVVSVEPNVVEVFDANVPDLDAPRIAGGLRPLRFRRAQRRIGEAWNRRQNGQVRVLRLPRFELVADGEGQTGSADALGPKCSSHESQHRIVDTRIGQPDDPLHVVIAASDPEVPDREAAGPERRRIVVVQSQRLGVRVDPRAEPGSREKPAGRPDVDEEGTGAGRGPARRAVAADVESAATAFSEDSPPGASMRTASRGHP